VFQRKAKEGFNKTQNKEWTINFVLIKMHFLQAGKFIKNWQPDDHTSA
jgi:hypothetical protein